MNLFRLSLWLGFASVGAATLAPLPRVHAAESAAQKKGRAEIVASYNQMNAALKQKNLADAMRFVGPDYESFHKTAEGYKSINREQVTRMWDFAYDFVDKLGVSQEITKMDTKFVSFNWRGADAVVVSQTTMVIISRKDGRAVRSESVALSRDFWSRYNDGWKIRQSVERQSTTWMDGVKVSENR